MKTLALKVQLCYTVSKIHFDSRLSINNAFCSKSLQTCPHAINIVNKNQCIREFDAKKISSYFHTILEQILNDFKIVC